MGSTLDLHELLDLILSLTLKEFEASQGSILLLDKKNDQLKMLAAKGLPDEVMQRGYVPRKGSIAEWVIEHDTPLILGDVSKETRFTSIAEERDIRSSVCVPLRAKGDVIGTINLTRTRENPFKEDDLGALVILAAQAAVSIENARLFEENLRAARLATIGQTTASISHDIKGVLTGLKGGAAVLEMGKERQDWKLIEQGWGLVKRGTDKIALMVLDMLDYCKDRRPVRSMCRTADLIREVFEGVEHAAHNARVELDSRIAPECETLYADYNQVFRAVLNLVTNAIDAIRESLSTSGRVEILVDRIAGDSPEIANRIPGTAAEFTVIRVRDNGQGIPPELVEEVFQPFVSSKGSRGTGLGLAVTQKVAREHGGGISVQSNIEEGTIFSLFLPISYSEAGGSETRGFADNIGEIT